MQYKKMLKKNSSKKMKQLLEKKPEYFKLPKIEENIEGRVVEASSKQVLIDIPGLGLGIARGLEIYEDIKERKLKKGDRVLATLLDYENEKGIAELSLKRAAMEFSWENIKEKKNQEEVFKIKIRKANSGGLVAMVDGIQGFIPVSQLSSLYYPRVENGQNSEIVKKLNTLVNKEIEVKIIDTNKDDNKLILSEKQALFEKNKDKIKKVKIGDCINGKITGLTPFGAFINFKGIEGMIYISEISWHRIEKPEDELKIGETVEAEVIDIDNEEVRLSLKRLKENIIKKSIKKFKKGDIVQGEIQKITPFGFAIKLDGQAVGSIHFSKISANDRKKLKRNMKANFKVEEVRVDDLKVELSFDSYV